MHAIYVYFHFYYLRTSEEKLHTEKCNHYHTLPHQWQKSSTTQSSSNLLLLLLLTSCVFRLFCQNKNNLFNFNHKLDVWRCNPHTVDAKRRRLKPGPRPRRRRRRRQRRQETTTAKKYRRQLTPVHTRSFRRHRTSFPIAYFVHNSHRDQHLSSENFLLSVSCVFLLFIHTASSPPTTSRRYCCWNFSWCTHLVLPAATGKL